MENPNPGLSIFNFHYAAPPVAVAINYGLNKVIGLNETGFNVVFRRCPQILSWTRINQVTGNASTEP